MRAKNINPEQTNVVYPAIIPCGILIFAIQNALFTTCSPQKHFSLDSNPDGKDVHEARMLQTNDPLKALCPEPKTLSLELRGVA
jgi:hypothetical protein